MREGLPKEIPLTTSIAEVNRQVTWLLVKDLLTKEEEPTHQAGPGEGTPMRPLAVSPGLERPGG